MRTSGLTVLLLTCAGCAGIGPTRAGWEFRVSRPPAVLQATCVNQRSGGFESLDLDGLRQLLQRRYRLELEDAQAPPLFVPPRRRLVEMPEVQAPPPVPQIDLGRVLEELHGRMRAIELRLPPPPCPPPTQLKAPPERVPPPMCPPPPNGG